MGTPGLLGRQTAQILIVEDDDDTRARYGQVLAGVGHTCREAASRSQAISRLDGDCDLVLLDLHLPGASGLDLLREIRAARADVPVLILTASDDQDLALMTLHMGAYGYLIKPARATELVINVANALYRRTLEADLVRTAEAERARTADLLETVVNALPVVLYALSPDGTVLLSEGRALLEMGSAPGASVGRSIFDLFAGESESLEHIRRALKGDEHEADLTLQRNKRSYHVSYKPAFDHDGSLSVITGLAVDVTESERVDRQLRAATRWLQDTLDKLPVAIFRVDRQGILRLARGSFLPEDTEQRIGKPMADAYPDFPELVQAVELALAGQDQAFSSSEGGRHFEFFVHQMLDDRGPHGALGFVIEVTEQRRAAEALERSERRSKLLEEQSRRQLQETLEATIAALAATVELRDPYTAGHQRRVAQLARAIAQDMGLDTGEVEGIFIAAGIHDIGKIAVPSEILAKPGPLSAPEFEIVKQHATAGAEIVSTVPFPWPVADMVAQHHERLNGSGYPHGLSDGDILLGARVIAVADAVEAMSARRPYRAARGLSAALGHIESDQGRLFDPVVVAACLRLFRERGFRFARE